MTDRKFSPSRCPITAEFLRNLEAVMGVTERLYMKENGVEIGEPSQGDYQIPVLEAEK